MAVSLFRFFGSGPACVQRIVGEWLSARRFVSDQALVETVSA
jgi:hypothetical protein